MKWNCGGDQTPFPLFGEGRLFEEGTAPEENTCQRAMTTPLRLLWACRLVVDAFHDGLINNKMLKIGVIDALAEHVLLRLPSQPEAFNIEAN
jgi:hypothetical protein